MLANILEALKNAKLLNDREKISFGDVSEDG